MLMNDYMSHEIVYRVYMSVTIDIILRNDVNNGTDKLATAHTYEWN